MRRSRSILLLVGGVYLVVIAVFAVWMDRRFRMLSSDALSASVGLIGRELATALSAAPGPILPTGAESRARLKSLVAEMTNRSESVRSLDVVDRDGRVVASDNSRLVGTQAAVVEEVLGDGERTRMRVPESALSPEAIYELYLPLVRDEKVVGYLRMAIASTVLSRLFAYQREQLLIWTAISLGAMTLLAVVLQQQFHRRGAAVARGLEAMISGRVTLPPVSDVAFSRVFEEAGRLAQQMRDADGATRERMVDQVVGLTRLHGALAHELKAPLHAMVLNVELLERALGRSEGSVGDGTARYLTVIKSEIGRLERSVNALGPEEARPSWEVVDLAEIVRGIADLLRAPAQAQGITITVGAEQRAPVFGFRDRLRQVVLNFANNAIDAMPDGGRLDLEVETSSHGWLVRVRDTGEGIPSAVLDRLEAGPVTTKDTGSGVGLYLARAIVEAHGGAIDLSTTVGAGTCCEIVLPAAEGEPT